MREFKKHFMVSYVENGIRRKFIVPADRRSQALARAEESGADPKAAKAVQELNKDYTTY
jgi:hypothetical protein